MSLSNLNKENVMSLFKMIHNNDDMQQMVHSVKNNYASYARLELIAKQMKMLQNEAEHILLHHQYNLDFQKMECRFKKVPGTMYYVFENENKDRFLSLIPPKKWNVLPKCIMILIVSFTFKVIQTNYIFLLFNSWSKSFFVNT